MQKQAFSQSHDFLQGQNRLLINQTGAWHCWQPDWQMTNWHVMLVTVTTPRCRGADVTVTSHTGQLIYAWPRLTFQVMWLWNRNTSYI